jgi:prophage regulatory protein
MQQSIYISDTQAAVRFSVSRATIWRWTQNGKFVQPVKLSPGTTRWKLSDIEAWETEQGCK